MRVWRGLIVLMVFGMVTGGWGQEASKPETEKLDEIVKSKPETEKLDEIVKSKPKTERLEGIVKGIIVGLNRATLAILSSRQIMNYLHTNQDKLPSWLRTGIEVTVHYQRGEDGSLWVEQITPYKPPEPLSPFITPVTPSISVSSPKSVLTSRVTSTPIASRQGSVMELRERRLTSRGLTSVLQNRISSLDPIEAEVVRLLPHYKAAAKFFNPNLTDEQAETITAAILRSSIQNGVDPRLVVAVIACESSFRPDAVGKKGEIGLGQLKPETAAGLGVDPYDPVQNIDGCVRYLKQQLDRFGSLELALAAYNAGPNAVSRASGIPQNDITPRYVKKALDLYRRLCGK